MANIEEKYQKKTDIEHVLDNPGTYTGSMEPTEHETYIYEDGKIKKRELKNIIMGLYKLFDEAVVNCRDHAIRQKESSKSDNNIVDVTLIDINIEDDGTIVIKNDGNGIDVVEHQQHKLWVPEMIFFHLRTGTNYNKKELKIVGGQNGFGAKLFFIWSSWGRIETVDHIRQKKYVQECNNNLSVIGKPKISKCKTKPYTKISFRPDYKRLGIHGLSKDMIKLLTRRVYDISAVTDRSVKVKLNNKMIESKHFEQYINLYIGDKSITKRVYEKHSERWEYCCSLSPTEEFVQVSFVNGIFTGKGGKHVDYIINQIIRKIQAYILKKKKIEVKPTTIKEQLWLFLRCDITNPSFESQTKDYLSTAPNRFGSSCQVSDQFCEKIAKMGVMEQACELTLVKDKKLAKKTDGTKTKAIRGIPKLVDANWAGTVKSKLCTLILCEGDSAKSGIISGLSREDRNIIGVYPMKGKLFNVRGESIKKVSENKEIVEIKKILGLETNKSYDTIEELEKCLRYRNILFMTDQDRDGSHIKGLGINLFQSLWNSLIKLGVIGFMNTPIVKASKGKKVLDFYNEGEYNTWLEANSSTGWKIKYYKGLGTSTGKEFKEYFNNKKIVHFKYTKKSDDMIDKVFNKLRANDRKDWLVNYNRNDYLDTANSEVTFEDFVDKELIHFSKYDCDRSIPNMMDGLKISLRKILYAAFKKRLLSDIKVAQFSGYVSEHSAYHHGEMSLNGAIVNMAQDFVGSNNINLLVPNGQFGSRLQGGHDSASERYIFTRLSKITRHIFLEEDDRILNYLDDDGQLVEPIYYLPIIPFILVNGSKGIGTGFSTDIPSYNPKDIINRIKLLIQGKSIKDDDILPYYKGFIGQVNRVDKNKFLILGKYKHTNKSDQIKITELPVGTWTEDYKKFLETCIDKKQIKSYQDLSTDVAVEFVVNLNKGDLKKLEKLQGEYGCNRLEKLLKLYSTRRTTNMYMFDENEQLKKYNNPEEIIREFHKVRYNGYVERKKSLMKELSDRVKWLTNKAKYIMELLEGTIDLRKKKRADIESMLIAKKYDKKEDSYKYLIKMPMDAVSEENVTELLSDKTVMEKELDILNKTTENEMWIKDLDKLEKEL